MSSYISFKGTFSTLTMYKRNDLVVYNNEAFVATANTRLGQIPPGSPWTALTKTAPTTAVSTLTSVVSGLQTQVASQSAQIAQYQTQVRDLNTTVAGFQATVAGYQSQLTQVLSHFQTLGLTSTALTLSPSGSTVPLNALLMNLLEAQLILPSNNINMPLKSAFSLLYSRLAAQEAAVADISGSRLPALLSEQLSNASLDAAREAAQALKDASQDAAAAQAALDAATAGSDIAAVSQRVSALESAPAFDATAITGRLDSAEAAIAGKADQSAVDAALAAKAAASDLSALDARVGTAEGALSGADSRLSALEGALPSKVAQSDYDVAIASLNASVASKAEASDLAAKADASALAAKEDLGRLHKTDYELVDVVGVNAAYWAGSLNATIGAIVAAGKVAMFRGEGAASEFISHFLSVADSAVAGDTYRFSNKSDSVTWRVVLGSQGGEVVDILAGETVTVVSAGSGAWQIL